MNLKEARQQKAIEAFIQEREADDLTSKEGLFNRLIRKMTLRKSPAIQETSSKVLSDD
jgi:hypothetical protein